MHPLAVWSAGAAGLLVFVVVVVLRGGPVASQNDAQVVTLPTAAISHGQWRLAELETHDADPPGYPLLASAAVTVLRPWLGSALWCSERQLPTVIAPGPQAAFYRGVLHRCADQRPGQRGALPPWYRSQGVLGVGAWLALLVGVELLLGAAYRRPTVAELLAAVALAALPAASDALVESFHPQDLLCVALTCAALSQVLRRRWLAAGALFGVAVLCKQFAVLAALPALATAPDRRARLSFAGAALAVVLVGLSPFLVADPSDTWHAVSGTSVSGAGVLRSGTVVGLLAVGEPLKLKLARDIPVVVAAALSLALWWRRREQLRAPIPLIGMVLVCMATRLVFEVSVLEYYFLAVAVFLLVLELASSRPPLGTLVWVLAIRYGVIELVSVTTPGWVAVAFLACAVAAAAYGLLCVVGRSGLWPRTTPSPAP